MFVQLLIMSWKCQKIFLVDLADVSFLNQTNQKGKRLFSKVAGVYNSSLSTNNTQEEINNSGDEDP